MQLNIYKISNPIIKLLSNSVKNNQIAMYEYQYRYLGLLIMYEAFRKYIEIDKIYIKYLNSIEDLYAVNCKQNYLIMSNLSDTYQMLSDIRLIVPNVRIIDINDETNLHNIITNNNETTYFILEKSLSNNNIISLINNLNTKKKIPLEKINIVCLYSYHEILNQIGNLYPMLTIYTTEIIYNNS
uniref:Uracil phosphoribosyltransferase n=1 Tax=Digenea simplex TaxID=945030 RepID=A0A1Z1MUJ7_DIGSM|nr:uracil phosphoribosyltransferase [Digenea simplex]ARW69636.1 uracil phosphoribosyltransferase [Digenea simplex]